MNQARRAICAGLLALGLPAGSVQGATYHIDIDGPVIDLSGTLEIGTTGTFALGEFDALVSSYAISVSNDGANAFLFTDANSSFGLAPPVTPSISVIVTATDIVLSSTSSYAGDRSDDILLASDDFVDGVRPNVIYNTDHVRYFTHAPGAPYASAVTYRDDFGAEPLAFATTTPPGTVPLPAGAVLYVPLVIGLWAMARRGRR